MNLEKPTSEILDEIIDQNFPVHPFSQGITSQNSETLMAEFLTMSKLFPYIQAGAHTKLIEQHVLRNEDIPFSTEVTSVVSSFLVWDEFGGHARILRKGQAGLPEILRTKSFHANLLQNDLSKIFNKQVSPSYSSVTKEYLNSLNEGLSSLNTVERVAHMVAFERHANKMIESLWSSLQDLYQVEKDSLIYFKAHVGGDDPAEAYHVAMTSNMIDHLISKSETQEFMTAFSKAYALNYNWCNAIKTLNPSSLKNQNLSQKLSLS